ncbi:hypothetical protein BDN70DRAFT_931251 [Pholiota conissans]|uniref:Uncharacterized protein n=1 Tax=Pholiota conissans TaxID=109636 RepID=A0A9P5Z541_9AGAR|nr:hypothetical protein BDN70DRAFT_931251 [Pholiota conissans]
MSPLFSLRAALLSFILAIPSVSAFSFSFQQNPTQCDNLALTWTGGTPPFQLLIIPLFGTQRNVSIPSSAFNNGQGSFSVQIPITKGQELVLTMSDATGFNSGGTTDILTVGASQGGTCNTTDPGVAFSYQLNDALQQCRPFSFSGYSAATQPVTITGIIPAGNTFILTPPVGSNSFQWNANVARGTQMIFMMTDAQGRPGGVSDIEIVTSSDDATCLNANSPTTTKSPPSTPTTSKSAQTGTTSSPTSSNTSTSSPTATASAGNGISIAAIAGTVIGALLFLAVIVTLGLFFLRKKRDERGGGGGGGPGGYGRQSRVLDSRIDLTYDPATAPGPQQYGMPPMSDNAHRQYPYTPGAGAAYASNPFLDSTPSIASGHRPSPSQFDASSMYTDARYAQSEVDQYEMPTQYGYNAGGAYQPPPRQQQSQLYPPSQNYSSGHPPPPAIDPFTQQYPTPPSTDFNPLTPTTGQTSSNRQSTSTSTSAAQRKAAAAGVTPYKPSRFIVHTDVEDVLPPTAEEEVIELPPQYTERRGPQPQIPNPLSSPVYAGHSPRGEDSLLPYS